MAQGAYRRCRAESFNKKHNTEKEQNMLAQR